MQHVCLLALGGNLPSKVGSPEDTLKQAFEVLADFEMRIVQKSALYSTPCFPAGAGPDFVNAAAVVETTLPPDEVLQQLHSIEAQFGRQRHSRWAGRTLDIDLIGYAGQILPDIKTFEYWRSLDPESQMSLAPEQLILPHPRMHERAFVLVPLNEVAGGWQHPVLGQTVAQMLANLPESDQKAVVPL